MLECRSLRDSFGWNADSSNFSFQHLLVTIQPRDGTVNVLRIKIIQPGNWQYINVDQFPTLVQPKKLYEHTWALRALSEGMAKWWEWINGWKGLLRTASAGTNTTWYVCVALFHVLFIILCVFVWNVVKKEY